jgi:hypothetical protein
MCAMLCIIYPIRLQVLLSSKEPPLPRRDPPVLCDDLSKLAHVLMRHPAPILNTQTPPRTELDSCDAPSLMMLMVHLRDKVEKAQTVRKNGFL